MGVNCSEPSPSVSVPEQGVCLIHIDDTSHYSLGDLGLYSKYFFSSELTNGPNKVFVHEKLPCLMFSSKTVNTVLVL